MADPVGDAGCAVVERTGEGGAKQRRAGDPGGAGRERPIQSRRGRQSAGRAGAGGAGAGGEPVGTDAVSVQPVEADAGAEYGCGGVAVQGLSGAVEAQVCGYVVTSSWPKCENIGHGGWFGTGGADGKGGLPLCVQVAGFSAVSGGAVDGDSWG